MNGIAYSIGSVTVYYSSLVIALGLASCFCLTWSLYRANGGKAASLCLFLLLSTVLSVVLSRILHWDCHSEQYRSFLSAVTDYGTGDFVLLLACEDDIENGKLDTAKVKAFRAPAGAVVEVYATALHYAPCQVSAAEGFRVAVALPKGTNTEMPVIEPQNEEDRRLWARNKWLLAHRDSSEASKGAYIGLTGDNIDIKEEIV